MFLHLPLFIHLSVNASFPVPAAKKHHQHDVPTNKFYHRDDISQVMYSARISTNIMLAVLPKEKPVNNDLSLDTLPWTPGLLNAAEDVV